MPKRDQKCEYTLEDVWMARASLDIDTGQDNVQHQLALSFAISLGSLGRKQDNGKTGFDIEFESLCSIDKNMKLNSAEFATAQLPYNYKKNRYTDILASLLSILYWSYWSCNFFKSSTCRWAADYAEFYFLC